MKIIQMKVQCLINTIIYLQNKHQMRNVNNLLQLFQGIIKSITQLLKFKIKLGNILQNCQKQFKYPMQSILKPVINELTIMVKQSLAQIVLSLESDQFLEQMRNDSSLYNQKMNYIQEIIKENLNFDVQLGLKLQNMSKDNQELTKQNQELMQKIDESKQQYLEQLSNIEVQYKKFLQEKEQQKIRMQSEIQKLNQLIFELKKNKATQSSQIKHSKIQIDEIHKQNQELGVQIQELKGQLNMKNTEIKELKKKLQNFNDELATTRKEYDSKNKEVQKDILKFKNISQTLQKQLNQSKLTIQSLDKQITEKSSSIKEYQQIQIELENTIQKMREDMFLIKEQWEKKCNSIQQQCQQLYREKLIENEQLLNKKLQTYIGQLKLGKNVIIQSSQEILQSKKILLQRRYQQDVKRYEADILELQGNLKDVQAKLRKANEQIKLKNQELSNSQKVIENVKSQLQRQLKKVKDQHQTQIKNIQKSKIDPLNSEIQRLHKTQTCLLKDLKQIKGQRQSTQKEILSIRSEFERYKQRQYSDKNRIMELQSNQKSSSTKILEMNKQISSLHDKISNDQKLLKQQNAQLSGMHDLLEKLKSKVQEFQHIIRKQDVKISELNTKNKHKENCLASLGRKADKLFILIRKLSKQLTLLKQDISFMINVQKSSQINNVVSLNEEFMKIKHEVEKQNKQKIKDLLNQFQYNREEQKQQFTILIRENQNMKKQIKLMQKSMIQKQQQSHYDKERTVGLEVEKSRILMQDDIAKQRKQKRRLQEKIYELQKKHDYILSKTEKQVGKQVRVFIVKWQNKVQQLQEILQFKQKHLKQTCQHLKKVLQDIKQQKQTIQNLQDRATKHDKKYQNLKDQRDKTVNEIMKRLQKQNKHKLSLERQLKQIRGELMKTQTHMTSTNSNSPFNNYSFTDRENNGIHTNAFQLQPQRMKTQKAYGKTSHYGKDSGKTDNHRQKELSEIREMIAKTYKVVQGPQKDYSPINKAKLF